MRRLYGAPARHLVVLALSFAVAAYAVTRVLGDPALWRIALWFVGAAVAWDLVLGPLLAGADRALRAAAPRLRGVSPVNHVRVPVLVSGTLLLVAAPSVLRRSEGVFAAKSGLSQDPYLGRWLAVTAVLLAGSAVLLAVRVARARD